MFKVRWYEKYATFVGRKPKVKDENTAPDQVDRVGCGERRKGYADGHVFKDTEPEEFGSKVPGFGVEMVERLEKKSCQGVAGWEKMDRTELCGFMTELLEDINMIASDDSESMVENRDTFDEILLKKTVDLANYAFFMWWNTKQDKASRANG